MTDWQGMTLAHNLGGAGNAEPPRPASNGGAGPTQAALDAIYGPGLVAARSGRELRTYDRDTSEDVATRDAWMEWHQTK